MLLLGIRDLHPADSQQPLYSVYNKLSKHQMIPSIYMEIVISKSLAYDF